MIKEVIKRDGSLARYDRKRISSAIGKVFRATKTRDKGLSERLALVVERILEKKFKQRAKVEDIQDTVEEVLLNQGLIKATRAYVLYREKHRIEREKRGIIQEREPALSLNSLKVLQRRYLLRDKVGNIIETPKLMFKRVAKSVALAEEKKRRRFYERLFYDVMLNLEFLPNSPTLMNAGTRLRQLSACFVLPIEDSLKSIFTTLKNTALIEQSGGGVGFSFSRLRPRGDIVNSTKGVASGPVSFMKVFDKTTEVIKSGGKRRGAMMGILDVGHPDIIEFVSSKSLDGEKVLSNFNISVALSDEFMGKTKRNEEYELINPRTKRAEERLSAGKVFDLIVEHAWKTGDPGVIFIDRINEDNPVPSLGRIESTNPCGEQPLLPYEACNLGSINLARMVENKEINWQRLEDSVKIGIRFLDDVIDVNKFPLEQVEKMTKMTRKIGLGVMGFAEMLIQLNIPYESNEALRIAEKLMRFIHTKSIEASLEIAKEKGNFPLFEKSRWRGRLKEIRNAALNTIAPTGSISIIAGTTSGIEPLFAVSYVRRVMEGVDLIEVNPLFGKMAKEKGFYSEGLMRKITSKGSLADMKGFGIPNDVKRLFLTAHEIKPEWHVKIQSVFQKHTDNAVSKTINLPANAKVEDVKSIFRLAHKLKCKGVTVYRYGSKKEQVLSLGLRKEKRRMIAHSEYAGGCPSSCVF